MAKTPLQEGEEEEPHQTPGEGHFPLEELPMAAYEEICRQMQPRDRFDFARSSRWLWEHLRHSKALWSPLSVVSACSNRAAAWLGARSAALGSLQLDTHTFPLLHSLQPLLEALGHSPLSTLALTVRPAGDADCVISAAQLAQPRLQSLQIRAHGRAAVRLDGEWAACSALTRLHILAWEGAPLTLGGAQPVLPASLLELSLGCPWDGGLAQLLGAATQLRRLELEMRRPYEDLHQEVPGTEAVVAAVAAMPGLTHLSLSGDDLPGIPLDARPLSALRSLAELVLHCLQLPGNGSSWGPGSSSMGGSSGGGGSGGGGEGLLAFPELHALTQLQLHSCGAPAALAAELPALAPRLRHLELSCVEGPDMLALASAATGLTCLELLHVEPSGPSWQQPALHRLSRLSALQRLVLKHVPDLQTPAGGGDGLMWLEAMPALTHLSLHDCSICWVPQTVSALGQLQELELVVNKGLGDPLTLLPLACWPACASLTRVSLSHCGLLEVPSVLDVLSNLKALDLSYMRLGGAAGFAGRAGPFAPLSKLTALQWLSLEGCGLGRLPRELAALSQLEVLRINYDAALVSAATLAALTSLTSLHLTAGPQQYVYVEDASVKLEFLRVLGGLPLLEALHAHTLAFERNYKGSPELQASLRALLQRKKWTRVQGHEEYTAQFDPVKYTKSAVVL